MTFRDALTEQVGKWMTLSYGGGLGAGGYVGTLERIEADFVVMSDAEEPPTKMTIHIDSVTAFVPHARGTRAWAAR
jgi:hypothetical protein